MLDLTYPPIIATCKAGFRILGQKVEMPAPRTCPRKGGVLLACNHIGYVDFVYGGLAANPSGRKVRFMAKREIFDHTLERAVDALVAPHRGRPGGQAWPRTAPPWTS